MLWALSSYFGVNISWGKVKLKSTILLLLIVAWSFTYCDAQNLIEATKRYIDAAKRHSLNKSYDFDPTYIKERNIKSISKYVTRYISSSAVNTRLESISFFNRSGTPLKKILSPDGDSTIFYFKYDSATNLVERTEHKGGKKKNIINWEYNQNGAIVKATVYSLIDFIPSYGGFPEKMLTIACDKFIYDFEHSSVTILDLCDSTIQYEKYPSNSERDDIQTTLRFYENGKLLEQKVQWKQKGKLINIVHRFDECGNKTFIHESGADHYINLIYIDSCDALVKDRIINIDTLRIPGSSNKVITYSFNSSFEGKEVIKMTIDNNEHVLSKELYRTDAENGMLLYSDIINYTKDHQVASQKTFYSALSILNPSGRHDSQGYHPPVDMTDSAKYEYYENGFLKSISTLKFHRLMRREYYEKEYYEIGYYE